MSRDTIAQQIIREAINRGYDPVPPLATAIQESSLDPGAVGGSGRWVGIYQQDDSYSDRYNAAAAIRQFFDRLDAKRETAGWSPDLWLDIFWLQQRPGEPSADTAYANGRKAYLAEIQSRTAEAQHYVALYGGTMADIPAATYYDTDRSSEFAFGGPRNTANILGICIHDTEGVTSAQADSETDDNITTYQCTSRTGSYHVMVGVDGERIRQNTDDWATWSTGNKGNDILLHLCFVGSASQTRDEWLAQDKMLRAGATVVRYWSDKYRIPLRRVDAAHLPGILGHGDTRVWGGTDHTDPGSNFPYDVLIQYATDLSTPEVPVPQPVPSNDAKIDYIYGQLQPYPQLAGKPEALDALRKKIADGMDLTLVDAVAAHIHGLFR